MNVNDEDPRITDTNSATDFSGTVFAIALPLFRWVVAALVAGLFLFLIVQQFGEFSVSTSLLVAFGPAIICAVVVILLFQGKPPSHAMDLMEYLMTRGDSSPLTRQWRQ